MWVTDNIYIEHGVELETTSEITQNGKKFFAIKFTT